MTCSNGFKKNAAYTWSARYGHVVSQATNHQCKTMGTRGYRIIEHPKDKNISQSSQHQKSITKTPKEKWCLHPSNSFEWESVPRPAQARVSFTLFSNSIWCSGYIGRKVGSTPTGGHSFVGKWCSLYQARGVWLFLGTLIVPFAQPNFCRFDPLTPLTDSSFLLHPWHVNDSIDLTW